MSGRLQIQPMSEYTAVAKSACHSKLERSFVAAYPDRKLHLGWAVGEQQPPGASSTEKPVTPSKAPAGALNGEFLTLLRAP
ncbi:hypothetical protein VTN00DRAFT_3883 [Thermoascus crustaceus]|uniref:uncharacterized protein n=1 Tax=Thermoascus crustaceus TaxID=5088 RepID=UPI003743C6EF